MKLDYQSTLKSLAQPLDIPFHELEKNLNSKKMNQIFRDYEACLNRLYEKSRELDQLYLYTKEYIAERFAFESDKIREQLNILESGCAPYTAKEYECQSIFLSAQSEYSVRDRDGTTLAAAQLANGLLTFASDVETLQPQRAAVKSSSVPYANHIDGCLQTGRYEAYYTLPKPAVLTEEITFYFDCSVSLNCAWLETFHAAVEKITAECRGGQQVVMRGNLHETLNGVDKIKIQIQADASQPRTVAFDAAAIERSGMNLVKDSADSRGNRATVKEWITDDIYQ